MEGTLGLGCVSNSKLSLIEASTRIKGFILLHLDLHSPLLPLPIDEYPLHLLKGYTIHLKHILLTPNDSAVLYHIGSYGDKLTMFYDVE